MNPAAPSAAFGFDTPFFEQIEFFRNKLNLPSERWDDIKKAAHDRAFIVAGVMKADLLSDLNGAVDNAIAGGGGEARRRRAGSGRTPVIASRKARRSSSVMRATPVRFASGGRADSSIVPRVSRPSRQLPAT